MNQLLFGAMASVLAGVCVGFGIYLAKVIGPSALANFEGPSRGKFFGSVLMVIAAIQILTSIFSLYLPTSPFLGFHHIVGGFIFGLGLAISNVCPLTLFSLVGCKGLRTKGLLGAVLFVGGVLLIVFISEWLSIFQRDYYFGLALSDFVPVDWNYLVLGVGLICMALAVLLREKGLSGTELVSGGLLSIGILISAKFNISIGTIASITSVLDITSDRSILQSVYFIALLLVIILFVGGRIIVQHEVHSRELTFSKVSLSGLLMGVGGGIGGGCTLSALFEGLTRLNLSTVAFTLSGGLSYLVVRRIIRVST